MKQQLLGILFIGIAHQIFGQSIQINFDYQNAEQTLKLLESRQITNSDVLKLGRLPGTRQLIAKIHSTDSVFYDTWSRLGRGERLLPNEGSYQYAEIRESIPALKKTGAALRRNEKSMYDFLTSKLSTYLPAGKKLSVTVYFILGGYSSAFAMGDDSTLYIALQHYKGDLLSIKMNCLHELFHNVQSLAYDESLIETQLAGDSAAYRVHSILSALFQEGTASYVADITSLDGDKNPHIEELLTNYEVNFNRVESDFYLFDRLVVDLYEHQSGADADQVYAILFDWNWNNPGYFIGQTMTESLAKAKGSAILNRYLRQDPICFIDDYIQLSKQQQRPYYRFSPKFIQIIGDLKKRIMVLK